MLNNFAIITIICIDKNQFYPVPLINKIADMAICNLEPNHSLLEPDSTQSLTICKNLDLDVHWELFSNQIKAKYLCLCWMDVVLEVTMDNTGYFVFHH